MAILNLDLVDLGNIVTGITSMAYSPNILEHITTLMDIHSFQLVYQTSTRGCHYNIYNI